MNAAYPSPATLDHLRVLAIVHYVFVVLGVLGLGLLYGHYLLLTGAIDPFGGPAPPARMPDSVLQMIRWMYAVIAALGLVWTALIAAVARSLQTRRNWWLCTIVSALNCLNAPLGTVLGVLTLVVLNQQGVQRSFD